MRPSSAALSGLTEVSPYEIGSRDVRISRGCAGSLNELRPYEIGSQAFAFRGYRIETKRPQRVTNATDA